MVLIDILTLSIYYKPEYLSMGSDLRWGDLLDPQRVESSTRQKSAGMTLLVVRHSRPDLSGLLGIYKIRSHTFQKTQVPGEAPVGNKGGLF